MLELASERRKISGMKRVPYGGDSELRHQMQENERFLELFRLHIGGHKELDVKR